MDDDQAVALAESSLRDEMAKAWARITAQSSEDGKAEVELRKLPETVANLLASVSSTEGLQVM